MKDIEKLNLIARICRSSKHRDPIKDILAVAESTFMDQAPEQIRREMNSTPDAAAVPGDGRELDSRRPHDMYWSYRALAAEKRVRELELVMLQTSCIP